MFYVLLNFFFVLPVSQMHMKYLQGPPQEKKKVLVISLFCFFPMFNPRQPKSASWENDFFHLFPLLVFNFLLLMYHVFCLNCSYGRNESKFMLYQVWRKYSNEGFPLDVPCLLGISVCSCPFFVSLKKLLSLCTNCYYWWFLSAVFQLPFLLRFLCVSFLLALYFLPPIYQFAMPGLLRTIK